MIEKDFGSKKNPSTTSNSSLQMQFKSSTGSIHARNGSALNRQPTTEQKIIWWAPQ